MCWDLSTSAKLPLQCRWKLNIIELKSKQTEINYFIPVFNLHSYINNVFKSKLNANTSTMKIKISKLDRFVHAVF